MNQKTIDVLEYGRILTALADQAGSEMAKSAISSLSPMKEIRDIREGLEQTDEAVRLMVHKGPLPIGGFYDLGGLLNYAKKGGALTMGQLLQVLYDMRTADQVVAFLKGDVPELPHLKNMISLLVSFPELAEELDQIILSEDEMADDASGRLRDIRRSMVRQNDALRNRLDRIIHSRDNQEILQDAIVTMRDGRYVIPVKAEHRSQVPGIVHDQSGSGATLFIEPQVVVEMNNQLRELAVAEEAEIQRILSELSAQVAQRSDQLENNQRLLVTLDMINARGKLAQIQRAECPGITQDGELVLKEARHPLLDPKKVVPIDVRIGEGYSSLIITGPNTGGKTVSLKTCGLLAMMAQTGLHIPASSESRIPVYEEIFADIGDEQSIEQSLSTFSSHMKNIVQIVEQAGERDLVLIDELGAGTDPTEGAALAIAILERLARQGTTVMATTHYNELKKYALSTDGVENASMEFDVESLNPTYHLILGTPGRSNAFDIGAKLGLDDEIIQRARQWIEGADLQFQDVLTAIEEDKKAAEAERDQALAMSREMERQRDDMKEKLKKAQDLREELLSDAKARAREIIAEAEQVSREVQEELRQLSRVESMGERNRRFSESRQKMQDAAGRYRERYIREVNERPVNLNEVQIGDRVKVISLNQNGEVIGLPDEKGELHVQVGALKLRADASDLQLIPDGRGKPKKQKQGKAAYGNMTRAKAQSIHTQIDVRGQTLDEAVANVEKYIDDAFMAGLPAVTIIHGRGEGVLQKGLRQQFRKNKYIAEFRKGGYNEGGDGVTVLTLKEK